LSVINILTSGTYNADMTASCMLRRHYLKIPSKNSRFYIPARI